MRIKGCAAAAAVALMLAGCGHVPVSTLVRLRAFDALRFDPAQLRIAAQSPDWLAPRPGGAHLKLTLRRGEETRVERFALQSAPPDGGLAAFAKAGHRIDVFRLAEADIARVRAMQADGLTRREDGSKATAVLAADIDACRQRDIPDGAILGSTLIEVDRAQGWMTLLSNVDLRKTASDAGVSLDARLPPCGR